MSDDENTQNDETTTEATPEVVQEATPEVTPEVTPESTIESAQEAESPEPEVTVATNRPTHEIDPDTGAWVGIIYTDEAGA